jgi:competence protein ComEC
MKRPLLAVALLEVCGILLAPLPVPLGVLFGLGLLLAALFALLPRARLPLLCALIILAGWTNLTRRTALLSPCDLRKTFAQNEAGVTVRGVLLETPRRTFHQDSATSAPYWTSTATIAASAVRPDGQDWQPAFGKIATTTTDRLPGDFFAGQPVEVAGVLEPARGPVAEGLFDYRAYLDHQGVYHEMRLKLASEWHILGPSASPPLADRFQNWARKSLALGLPQEDRALQLEWALTLGWKAALTDQVSEPFIRAATYHIFAVDGLRIAIFAGILIGLFRAMSIPRALCGLLTVPFILFYAAMTGWPASAVRAIVMAFVIFGGWALNRPGDLLNSLFAAVIIILTWEPRELFQAGFQLSFLVVLCIILILPFFERLGERLLRPDPLLPEQLRPRWQKLLHPPARWGMGLFLASVAAWLGSIPLVAYYFHLVTPVSGPATCPASWSWRGCRPWRFYSITPAGFS